MIERFIVKTRIDGKITEHYYYKKNNQLRCTYLNDGYDYECYEEEIVEALHRVLCFGDEVGEDFKILSIIFDSEEIDKILTMRELIL